MSETVMQNGAPEKRPGPSPVYASFPADLQYNFHEHFNRKFVTIYLVTFLVVGSIVFGLSWIKPANELTEKDVLKMKQRYASLELNKPKKEEPKEKKAGDDKGAGKKPQAVKTGPKIDRTQETGTQRTARKQAGSQERAQERAAMKEEIEQAGLFAELTALGSDGEGGIDDILAQGGVADLGSIDLSTAGFTSRPGTEKVSKERRGERVVSQGLGQQQIVKAEAKKIEVSADVQISEPENISGSASGESSRSAKNIEGVISKIRSEIKLLFEKYLRQDPSLEGKVNVDFVIKADGSVEQVRISSSTLNHSAFERRLVSMISRLRFPPASSDIQITYPFVFAAAKS